SGLDQVVSLIKLRRVRCVPGTLIQGRLKKLPESSFSNWGGTSRYPGNVRILERSRFSCPSLIIRAEAPARMPMAEYSFLYLVSSYLLQAFQSFSVSEVIPLWMTLRISSMLTRPGSIVESKSKKKLKKL